LRQNSKVEFERMPGSVTCVARVERADEPEFETLTEFRLTSKKNDRVSGKVLADHAPIQDGEMPRNQERIVK